MNFRDLRRFPILIAALVASVFFIGLSPARAGKNENAAKTKGEYLVYVGTYTGPKSQGIYAYEFKKSTGRLASLGLAAETTSPSFLAVDATRKYLYAVNEIGNYNGGKSGGVSSFAIDHQTGKLTFLNEVASRGADPCYVSLDTTGKYVLVANYGGGSVAVFPVVAGGKLGEATAFVQHTGSGVNHERQEGPHAHMINVTPDNRFAFAADLGLDELLVYRFDAGHGSLTPNDPPYGKVNPGLGPRHFALNPNNRFVYVITEMGSAITTFSYDAAGGVLRQIETVSTLPKDFKGQNDCAEIAIHPSGKFLYGSNRGHDSIAVFAVDLQKGTLTPIEHMSTHGKTPRNFAIDPTGNFLLAANQDTNNVVVFRIDSKTGRLTATGEEIDVPSPVCVTFVAK